MDILKTLRTKRPLIHCITNYVTANFQANALLALGASPVMAEHIEEVEDVTAVAGALVLNIGTLQRDKERAMVRAGKRAMSRNIPIIFDPVGVGAMHHRRRVAHQLLTAIQPTVIRCNAGEAATLANVEWQAKGVDQGTGTASVERIARTVAQRHQCIVVVTGERDIVTDGQQLTTIEGGSHWMTSLTGTGCVLSAILAAYCATHCSYATVVEAVTMYKRVATLAEQSSAHIGQFEMECLHYLHLGGYEQ